jgi:diguanylate cyclase (GGDEF)-like protein
MLPHSRAVGDTPAPERVVRRWELWSIPRRARAFLLLTEFCALGATLALLVRTQPSSTTLIRFATLVVLTIGYSEIAARSERVRQYLGGDRVSPNPLSVWSFAAVLTIPVGWAAALIVVQYGHALIHATRDGTGLPHRIVFTGAAAVLAQLVAAAALFMHSRGTTLAAQAVSTAAVLSAMVLFTAVSLVLLLTGMWLNSRGASFRALLPDRVSVGYELAMLVLGVAVAQVLLHRPLLTPVLLILIAYLHRSSVVTALQHAARTDAKTGLLNVPAWSERAEASLSRGARAGRPVTVMLIDIDHFKSLNDTHGHLVGDRVLVAIAAVLRRELRGHDALGRFGGDEFVAACEDLDPAAAEQVGERMRAAVAGLRAGGGLPVSVSIGIASQTDDPCDLADLLGRADAALYCAKAAGRDAVRRAGDRDPAP